MPGGAGYFVPTMPNQRFFTPQQLAQVRPTPRWQGPQSVRQPTTGDSLMFVEYSRKREIVDQHKLAWRARCYALLCRVMRVVVHESLSIHGGVFSATML